MQDGNVEGQEDPKRFIPSCLENFCKARGNTEMASKDEHAVCSSQLNLCCFTFLIPVTINSCLWQSAPKWTLQYEESRVLCSGEVQMLELKSVPEVGFKEELLAV